MTRIGIYGWGVVAPRSPNIDAFAHNLESAESWLSPFKGFGPSNFLVGQPSFNFNDYKSWINEHFLPTRFPQMEKKLGAPSLYAVGSFIQSLRQNPGIDKVLKELGTQAHVYVGTGLGDFVTTYEISLNYHRAQRNWDRFWSDAERNSSFKSWKSGSSSVDVAGMPADPATVDDYSREAAESEWWHWWAERSDGLERFLSELREIESLAVQGDVEKGKLSVLKEKKVRSQKLLAAYGAPTPPWDQVSANFLWNIHNTPASQISMMGHITGMTFAPVAACALFGYAIRLAMQSINAGAAKAVVIGMTDPPPHPLSVGGFYNARVASADGGVSRPLTELKGTHVGGGSCVWILGDHEFMSAKGFKPLGMEPVSVGVSADADHIITPSREGPQEAIMMALRDAGLAPADVTGWDLHATATPGDYLEVENLRSMIPESVLVTARKGTFGHGMSVSGGWELTAQYLGYERGRLFPTPLTHATLNHEIAGVHTNFVFDDGCPAPTTGVAGKLSMGVGGINACVLSRPWPR